MILTPSPQIDWAYLSAMESEDCPFSGQRGTSFPLSLSVIRNQNIVSNGVFNISDYIMRPAQKANIGRQETKGREEKKKDPTLHDQKCLSSLSLLVFRGWARWPSPHS